MHTDGRLKQRPPPQRHRFLEIWNRVDAALPFLFPLPAIAVMLLVIVYPIYYLIDMSFQSFNIMLETRYIGFRNFERLLSDATFWSALQKTGVLVLLSVVGATVLGVMTALVLQRDYQGVAWLRVLFLLPMFATPVAVGLVWMTMFHPELGVINYLLRSVGLPDSLWLASPATVIPSIALVDIWQRTPLVMLIVLAGLRAMPNEPFEAATIDGANRLQLFRFITLPLLRPALTIAIMFTTIDAIKTFDKIFVMTQGGPARASETLSVYAYLRTFSFMQLGYGSAIIFIFALLTMVLSWLFIRFRRGLKQ